MDGGYKALVEDMKLVTDWAATHFRDVPIVLLGHSMGSMAARIYAKKYDWELSGLILCGSPGYNVMAPVSMILTGFLCLFNDGHLKPVFLQDYASSRFNRKFASEGGLAWVCSDSGVRNDMKTNPLTNYHITANMMHNLLLMMVQTYSRRGWYVRNPELPVTFLSGEDDATMLSEKKLHDAAKMMARVGYNNVSAAIFSEMRHETLNEVDKEVVWNDILNFIRDISSK
jgi:alpha-beta hydrolase superfamily lysophospholipase